MVKFEVSRNEERDYLIKIVEGQDELVNALKKENIQSIIIYTSPTVILPSDGPSAIRQFYHMGSVEDVIAGAFGLTHNLGLEYIFVNTNGNEFNFN